MSGAAHPHRIVIVGGGAGGLPLAARLGDKLGKRGRAEVTLVDWHDRHLWKPLLHEVAAGRMDADVHGVDYLALGYWHHFRFRQGSVEGLDRARHELTLSEVHDDDGALMLPRRVINYDTLFWSILGVLVVANVWYEAKQKKRLPPSGWRGKAIEAAQIVITMSVFMLLWSLWGSNSVTKWLYFLKTGEL